MHPGVLLGNAPPLIPSQYLASETRKKESEEKKKNKEKKKGGRTRSTEIISHNTTRSAGGAVAWSRGRAGGHGGAGSGACNGRWVPSAWPWRFKIGPECVIFWWFASRTSPEKNSRKEEEKEEEEEEEGLCAGESGKRACVHEERAPQAMFMM